LTNTIGDGDDVLLYLDPKRTYLVKVETAKSFHTHKGFVRLDELIGKDFGSRILSSLEVEFIALKQSLREENTDKLSKGHCAHSHVQRNRIRQPGCRSGHRHRSVDICPRFPR
jgi:hypothetical protein